MSSGDHAERSRRAADDLHEIRQIVARSSERIDEHAFHYLHWGVVVLLWFPLANWLQQRELYTWMVIVGGVAIVCGSALSAIREVRLERRPRLEGANAMVARQHMWMTYGSLAGASVLSFVLPATGVMDGRHAPLIWGLAYANMAFHVGVLLNREFVVTGILIFAATVAAAVWSQWSGYILGPAMGLGMIVPAVRAEARVRALSTADVAAAPVEQGHA